MKINWELVILIITLIPSAIRLFAYIGLRSTSRSVKVLTERALIIAQAMEETQLTPTGKKEEAVRRLLDFAKEVAIKLSSEQASDYIEYSVNELRAMGVKDQ